MSHILPVLLSLFVWIQSGLSLSATPNRRQIVLGGVASIASINVANAATTTTTTPPVESIIDTVAPRKYDIDSIDMKKLNSVRTSVSRSSIVGGSGDVIPTPFRGITPMMDPSPTLVLRGGIGGASTIQIPRVGYSFYKTPVDQAERCTILALRAGIRHLDMATSYESNPMIAKALQPYLDTGIMALDFIAEKQEVLDQLDMASQAGEMHAKTKTTMGSSGSGWSVSFLAPPPMGSIGRRGRRDGLFLSHKLSNNEQSVDAVDVRRSIKATIATLGCSYLDLVSIHSPLTNKERRLTTYKALLELRDSGLIKSVGVCNYGLGPLQEIATAGLELPAINQLELSPFNAHMEIVDWCDKNGVAIACSAWSKLSGADGPMEGWDILSKLAQQKGMTKAQVLVRWSLQKGYVCVPRSASASKIERFAIAENSYGGVNPVERSFVLTPEEMATLDSLDVGYKAGKLGRRDGWLDSDVTGSGWDPTDFV